jgi:hypothetical protein
MLYRIGNMREKRKNLKKHLNRFFAEQDAQATTEYILMLSIIVSIFFVIFKAWVRPNLKKLADRVSTMIEDRFIKADLHTFRF